VTAEQTVDAGKPYEPETLELQSVSGCIVFDLPGAPVSAGGTRLAPDVTVSEVALLARAMTYKFAALGAQVAGAKAGVVGDPGDRPRRAELMTRYCAEIAPLIRSGRFITGPDMGTFEEDFASLRDSRGAPGAMSAVVGGVPFEDLLTGFGVTVAAETALRAATGSGWDGRSAAIEGFGKVGGGMAREVLRRGGRLVAISTVKGSVADPAGLDVDRLLALRREYGDDCVAHYGRATAEPRQLFSADADVIVPGARPGAISGPVAESLSDSVRVVSPAANVPYTREGADVLQRRSIAALPDFVCNAGAVIGYRSGPDATPDHVLENVTEKITDIMEAALQHPDGPLAGGCERAAAFLRTWWGEPPAPPFAA